MSARSRKVGLGRIGRWLVPAIGVAVVVSMATVVRPAAGADNPPQGLPIRQTNYFYAYVGEGESLSATFAKIRDTSEAPDAPIAVRVEGPAGAGAKQCDIDGAAPLNANCTYADLTSTEPGIWRISFLAGPQRTTLDWYTWDITVRRGAVAIPGRVWADYYLAVQPSVLTGSPIDVSLWYQQRFGYTYRGDFQNLQGIDSLFNANASGNRLADTCLPIYRSVDIPVPVTLLGGSGGCGSYKIFFAPPSPTLPATAKRWDGTEDWVYRNETPPSVKDLSFERSSNRTAAGIVHFEALDFVGPLAVEIDTNNNGSYSDNVDRTLPYFVQDPAMQSVPFDGNDGLGHPIARIRPLRIRVSIKQAGEIHFVSGDIEGRSGLRITLLSSNGSQTANLHWDDRFLETDRPLSDGCGKTPILDARAGVDSITGVHGWAACLRGWGNQRYIDDWTFQKLDPPVTDELRLPGVPLLISKVPSKFVAAPGERVVYTITVYNPSDTAVAASAPIPLTDDLSGALDDAIYNDDATAGAGVVSYDQPRLMWTGPVAPHGTVQVTYSLTVRDPDGGDQLVHNVVTAPGTSCELGCPVVTVVHSGRRPRPRHG